MWQNAHSAPFSTNFMLSVVLCASLFSKHLSVIVKHDKSSASLKSEDCNSHNSHCTDRFTYTHMPPCTHTHADTRTTISTYWALGVAEVDIKLLHRLDDGHHALDGVAVDHRLVRQTLVLCVALFVNDSATHMQCCYIVICCTGDVNEFDAVESTGNWCSFPAFPWCCLTTVAYFRAWWVGEGL